MIEEVRARSDIVAVVSQHVRLKRQGRDYVGLCPFHNEKSPSFTVSPSKQLYYCFGCGAGGNVFAFVMQYENQTFSEALQTLADKAGVSIPRMEYSGKAKETAEKRDGLLEIAKEAAGYYYHQLRQEAGSPGLAYLSGRKLSQSIIRSFGLGYAPSGGGLYRYLKEKGFSDELLSQSGLFSNGNHGMYDRFRGRVIFPIMNANSKVIGFGGRVLDDTKPKYLNSPENLIFDKGRNLYGLHAARKTREDSFLLCEGYMDVIAMHQAGFTNAVASLGTALTEGHAALIRRYVKKVLLLYDSDGAGIRAALRAIPILRSAQVSAKVVNMEPAKDPDEFIKTYGKDAFAKRLAEARDAVLFEMDRAAAACDMSSPQGINEFFDRVAAILLPLTDELERTLYLEAVVKEYADTGVTAKELKKRLSLLAMKLPAARASDVYSSEPVPYEGAEPAFRENRNKKKTAEGGGKKAQKLLLTWLVTYPELFPVAAKYVKPEDFTEPFYQEIAGMLFEQYDQGEINPAKLMNVFTLSEEQSEVAGLFNASIPFETRNQLEQAFADAVLRIREDSFSKTDLTDAQAVVKKKKELLDLRHRRQEISEACRAAVSGKH